MTKKLFITLLAASVLVYARPGRLFAEAVAASEAILFMDIPVAVGTRGAGRGAYQAFVPIDVVTKNDIERSGEITVNRVLQRLLPSFNYIPTCVQDGSDFVQPATLRGLNPDQVLVLINGKRRHSSPLLHVVATPYRGSGQTDLDAIPVNAIERIEILRDGAAAQYGSDAIAGIINIVLKSGPGENSVGTSYGAAARGDGETTNVTADLGFAAKESGFLRISGSFMNRGATNRAGPDTRAQYFAGDSRNDNPPKATMHVGDPHIRDSAVFFNGSLPMQNSSLYAFGGYNFRTGESGGFFRRPLDDRNVRAIYPDGFLPLIAPDISDYSLAAGIKGEAGDWSVDLSNTIGLSAFNFRVKNSLNASMGTASPTSFDCGTLKTRQDTVNLDLFKALDIGTKEPLKTGIGAEFRYEGYEIVPGEEASYKNGGATIIGGPNDGNPTTPGAQVFPGFSPLNKTDVSRKSLAAYLDLEKEVAEGLMSSLAFRLENFSDFGSTFDGKAGVHYQLFEPVIVRGTAGTGYRAPSLAQSHFSSISTMYIAGVPHEVGTFPVDHPLAKAMGFDDLYAEKSRHASMGFILTPSRRSMVSADYFYTYIQDRIVRTESFLDDPSFGAEIQALLQQYNTAGAQFFTNAINTRTHGVDVTAKYSFDLDNSGVLDLTCGANFNETRAVGGVNIPAVLTGHDAVVFSADQKRRVEKGTPKNNLILKTHYSYKAFTATASGIRFGATQAKDPSLGTYYKVRAAWVADINMSLRLSKHYSAAIGGNNIFNSYPQKPSLGSNGFSYNQADVMQNVNGAFYFAKMNWLF